MGSDSDTFHSDTFQSETAALRRREAGFSFIEILVVMGIISVLVSMVVVIIPKIQEKASQTKSKDNVKSMVTLIVARQVEKGWPPYSGKNFVLSLVATNELDQRNKQNLAILFSPGDTLYGIERVDLDRYKDVRKKALKNGTDFHELTSYAGRRNGSNDRDYLITPDQASMGTIIICDDDEGALHHPGGIVAGYSNGSAVFLEWEDLDMVPPEDADHPEPFLGDNAENEELMKMSGQ